MRKNKKSSWIGIAIIVVFFIWPFVRFGLREYPKQCIFNWDWSKTCSSNTFTQTRTKHQNFLTNSITKVVNIYSNYQFKKAEKRINRIQEHLQNTLLSGSTLNQ